METSEKLEEPAKKSSSNTEKKYSIIDISDVPKYIEIFHKYMLLHPEFFKTNIGKKYKYVNEQLYSIFDEPLAFKDTIFKARGHIITKFDEKNKYILQIFVQKRSVKKCYIEQIEEYVLHQSKYGDNVQLFYYKILGDALVKHCYYNEPVTQWLKDTETLEKEFFLTNKTYLLSVMKNKIENNSIGSMSNTWNNLILTGKPGTGKCFAKGTKVLLYNGKREKVEDITVGTYLMGDDGTPRTVLSLTQGKEPLYNIVQGSDTYTVNLSHVLVLFCPKTKWIIYDEKNQLYRLFWINPNNWKIFFRSFYANTSIDGNIMDRMHFIWMSLPPEQMLYNIPLSTYINLHPFIKSCLFGVTTSVEKYGHRLFREKSTEVYEIIENKLENGSLTDIDLYGSFERRLQCLAVIVDNYFKYNEKLFCYSAKPELFNSKLKNLAKSVGFCYVNGGHIMGPLHILPTRVVKCNKNFPSWEENIFVNGLPGSIIYNGRYLMMNRIEVHPKGEGDYYGFEVDGNNRFLLGNYIITHNSSYVYRIAMMLKLSILSVDIGMYINKKKDLYTMFHGQEFSLPNVKDKDQKENAINNAIIVLEEFDHSVDKLCSIENVFKYKDLIKKSYLDKKIREFDDKVETIRQIDSSYEETPKIELPKVDENTSHENYMESMLLEDGIDVKNNKLTSDYKVVIREQLDSETDITIINEMLNNLIKNIDEDNRSNILRLSDMLELFQGPVPIKGRIIIATTNNFEKIRSVLPGLFRSGRMTRVDFGYLDWESFCQLALHYFKETPKEPFPIEIPTSEIIEIAIKNTLTSGDINSFIKDVKKIK